jgi:hypothetical protein
VDDVAIAVPSRDLVEAVLAHLRMTGRTAAAVDDLSDRTGLTAAVSEIAGFAGWLHWDMYDLGSERRYASILGKSRVVGRPARGGVEGIDAEHLDLPPGVAASAVMGGIAQIQPVRRRVVEVVGPRTTGPVGPTATAAVPGDARAARPARRQPPVSA